MNILRKDLAKQIGINSKTLATWLEHYTLNKFISHMTVAKGVVSSSVKVDKEFCRAFWHYLKHKNIKYKENFAKYYHHLINTGGI